MRFLKFIFVLLASAGAFAQFTTVTGTVTDPNGLPYSNATITALLVTSNTPKFSATATPYLPPTSASGLDLTGTFRMTLADNTFLSPTGTKWNFTVCSSGATVQPAFGKGPVCFSLATPITISGASQNISTQLNAVAPALTVAFGGSGNLPSGVTPGSACVSNGVGQPCVYQTKSILDVRDLGVDCTGSVSADSILNALTGNSPTTDQVINGRTVSFANCPNASLANTWLIKNQAGFRITGLTRSGANCSGPKVSWVGAANGVMIDMEYVDGFQVDGLCIQGGANAAVGLQVDKNGSGGILNTTDGRFLNNTYSGSNQNWIGLSISPVSISNVEDMRVEDSTFSCGAARSTTNAVGIEVGASQNAKNEIFKHNNFSLCFYGIYSKTGSFSAVDNEFSANGGTCATGIGADIRIDGSTDVDIIEGNLDESSTQGISNDNDVAGFGMMPVIVRGNHAAPAGCENTSLYWWNIVTGGNTWIFEGNSFDPDNNLLKIIGTNQVGGVSAAIFTNGNVYPNLLFNRWWQNGLDRNLVSTELGLQSDTLFTLGTIPSGGAKPSALLDLRSWFNGDTTQEDFQVQNIQSTLLIKNAQGGGVITLDGLLPSLTLGQISTPVAPGISVQGTGGSTTYTYSLVAYGPSGNTPGSATVSTSTGNATLSGTNFNQLSWNATGGATKYCVWRTVGGATQGNIGCTSAIQPPNNSGTQYAFGFASNWNFVTGQYLFNDTGLAGDSTSLPTQNSTGGNQLAAITFANLTAMPNGTVFYCSDCKNVADDAVAFDSTAAGVGHGTNVLRENGAWRVH